MYSTYSGEGRSLLSGAKVTSLFSCLVTIVTDEGGGTNDGDGVDGVISLFILDGDISCCN